MRLPVVLALLTLYLVWGSTYYAVKVALPAAPPLVMAAVRFWLAGGALLAIGLASGAERPTRRQLGVAALSGLFLFVGGNVGTVWAQTRIDSSVAALLVGLVPVWMTLIDAVLDRRPPGGLRAVGLALGVGGVATIVGVGAHVDRIGAARMLLGTSTWAVGSTIARRGGLPRSVPLATSAQMLTGAVAVTALAVAAGQGVVWAAVDARTTFAFLWLVVLGSLVAFTAYGWLLREVSPALATSYAYVNPLVAVAIGTAVGGEALAWNVIVGGALVIAAVGVLSRAR